MASAAAAAAAPAPIVLLTEADVKAYAAKNPAKQLVHISVTVLASLLENNEARMNEYGLSSTMHDRTSAVLVARFKRSEYDPEIANIDLAKNLAIINGTTTADAAVKTEGVVAKNGLVVLLLRVNTPPEKYAQYDALFSGRSTTNVAETEGAMHDGTHNGGDAGMLNGAAKYMMERQNIKSNDNVLVQEFMKSNKANILTAAKYVTGLRKDLTSQGTFVGFYLETVKCKADEKLFKIMISGKNADTDSEAALTNITNVVKASGLKQGSIKSALRKAWKLAQEGNLERIDEIQRVSRSNGKKYAEIDVVPLDPSLATGMRKARNPKIKPRIRRAS